MMITFSGTSPLQLPVAMPELDTLLSHVGCALLLVDAAGGRIVFRNDRAAALLAGLGQLLPNGDALTADACDAAGVHYAPHDFPIARALAGEHVSDAEVAFRLEDGSRRHLLMSAAPVRDAGGSVIRALVSMVDITAQREAERQAREWRAAHGTLARATRATDWTLDIRSGDARVDPGWFGLLGYAPDQVRQNFHALVALVHARDRARVLHHWHDFLQHGTGEFEISCRLRTAQHGWHWTLVRAAVTRRAPDGSAEQAAGVLADIDRAKRRELALHDNEQRLRSTLEYAGIGIATLSPMGRWLGVNPKLAAILGYGADELLHDRAIDDVLHPDELDGFREAMDRLLRNTVSSFTRELRCVRRDGREIWADVTVSHVSDEQVGVRYLIAVMEDRSDEKDAMRQAEKAHAQLRMATRIAGLGFWEWDPRSGEIAFSEESKTQFGYSDDELRARSDDWIARIHPDDRNRVSGYLAAYLDAPTPDYAQEFRTLHQDGSYRWISVRGIPVFDRRGELEKLVGTHLDITEQKEQQENTRVQAQHDPLTGLPNRGLFYEFSEHLLAAARRASTPLAVLFFDLDHFKAINDTYGHKIGDGLLREVAERLSQLMRAEDVIGRVGGDEFVAILPKLQSAEQASVVAGKALESLRQPYRIDGIELQMSPSIGISIFPRDGDNIDLLIQRADAAMYRVKHGERNNFRFFTSDPGEDGHAAQAMEDRLRAGLERKEFMLHYQPVIDTRTGEVVAVEALLRWRQGDGKVIDPSAFMPVAESTGLIVPLGEWIFEQACRQHQAWVQEGLPPISIGINISAAQLRRGEFQHAIGHAISTTGIDPRRIEIEVTESAVMKNFEQAADILHSLKLLGLKIALDDFGTGTSNLNQLSRLPLDKLKVDRSFVRYLGRDRSSRAIAEAIIALGRALDLDVVAEGIESEQDLDILREHECYQAQGFHLGRPMPGEQFTQWFKKHWLH